MGVPSVNPSNIITSERAEGPTPRGGAYSIIFYLDDDFHLTTKDVATHFEIEEYNTDGQSFFHTRGQLLRGLDEV